MAQYPCECCGHRTLDDPPGGTYQICPVCFWEDAPFPEDLYSESFSNGIPLRQAQRNYAEFGAVTPDDLNSVRPAEPEEDRETDWKTLDQQAVETKELVLNRIAESFHNVTRAGGVSLHQTVEIDSYGLETSQTNDNSDTGHDWRDVPHRDLAEICGIGGISFLDPAGWRYYLPAYMTWWLKGGEDSGSYAAECLLYALQLEASDSHGLRQYGLDRYDTLNLSQSKAVAEFLQCVRDFSEDSLTQEYAGKALESYWNRFTD